MTVLSAAPEGTLAVPLDAWCERFAVDGTVPRTARDLLAALRADVADDVRTAELAAALGVLRAHQGSSTVSLLEDVLALRPLLWQQAQRRTPDPSLLLLDQARLASTLDVVLRAALDAYVEESQAVLRTRATRDPLTGLLNRSAFEEALHREVDGRGERPSLLLIDLDGFKGVNDTFGHLAGDEVLVHVARLLQKAFRKADVVARLGGDEFALLLPSTTTHTAERLARRLLGLVEADSTLRDTEVPVGLSVGIARLDHPATASDLVAAADEAMYEAKRGGGQRLSVRSGGGR